jgi:hypothetical protein
MGQLDGMKKSISDMSDAELRAHLEDIRKGRINFSRERSLVVAKITADKTIDSMSPEDMAALLSKLQEES